MTICIFALCLLSINNDIRISAVSDKQTYIRQTYLISDKPIKIIDSEKNLEITSDHSFRNI